MSEQLIQGLQLLAQLLEIVGAGALVLGFIIGTVRCFKQSLQQGIIPAMDRYRRSLGRVILIGLEILVAATIIKTLTLYHTMDGIGLLALIVVIRTAIGWTTVLEMEGRWPWQKPRSRATVSQTRS